MILVAAHIHQWVFAMTRIVKLLSLQPIFNAGYRSQKALKIHKIVLGPPGYMKYTLVFEVLIAYVEIKVTVPRSKPHQVLSFSSVPWVAWCVNQLSIATRI